MRAKRREKRNPLKEEPIHFAGWSTFHRWRDEVDSLMAGWLGVAVGTTVCALMAWIQWLGVTVPPIEVTVGGFGATVIMFMYMRREITKREGLRLGYRTELFVGQFFEREAEGLGYDVLHDLGIERSDGVKFNVDHILIGPGGVYAVETKARSKPDRGSPRVVCD
jgi:hypothetical protein